MMNKQICREPMTSDLVFKAVYGQEMEDSKAALIALLNMILDRKEDPIIDLVYKNPFSIAEARENKNIVMDIKVETASHELIDIEMQMKTNDAFVDRTVYYGSKMFVSGLASGNDYDSIKKTIVISFVKGKLFPDKEPAHSIYKLKELTTNTVLTEALEYHYIELGKAEWQEKPIEQLNELEQLSAYMCCTGNPDMEEFLNKLVQLARGVITMTDKVLRKVSEDERLRAERESREMFEWEYKQNMRRAEERGVETAKKQYAVNMLKEDIAVNVIARVTGLSEDIIINLKEK